MSHIASLLALGQQLKAFIRLTLLQDRTVPVKRVTISSRVPFTDWAWWGNDILGQDLPERWLLQQAERFHRRFLTLDPGDPGSLTYPLREMIGHYLPIVEVRHEHRIAYEVYHELKRVGQRWSVLPLLTLLADDELVRLLYAGVLKHEMRHFTKRMLQPSRPGMPLYVNDWHIPHGTVPLDFSDKRLPFTWHLGPMVVLLVYAAYLVWTAPGYEYLQRLAPGIRLSLPLPSLFFRVIETLKKQERYVTTGDLLALDALVWALMDRRPPGQGIQNLAALSPITRITRLSELAPLVGNAPWFGLIALARDGQVAGIRARLCQHLARTDNELHVRAGAVQHILGQLDREIESTMEKQRIESTIAQRDSLGLDEGCYWAGSLLMHTYMMVWRAGEQELIELLQKKDQASRDFVAGIRYGAPSALRRLLDDMPPPSERQLGHWYFESFREPCQAIERLQSA